MGDRFDAEYDIVMIGGGMSGLSQRSRRARTASSCALLPGETQTGGSSSLAEGHAAFESDGKKSAASTSERLRRTAVSRLLALARGPSDCVALRRDTATSIVKLREELGVVYNDVQITAPDQPGELRTWHLPEGEIAHVIELQEAEARRRGVDIFLGTPAKRILLEDGKVAGVSRPTSTGSRSALRRRLSWSRPAGTRRTRRCSTSTASTASAPR